MAEKTMEQMKLTFGEIGAFHVNIEWRDNYGSDGPVGRTWGDLRLWIGDTLVWGERDSHGQAKGITWNWIDLLEFLGNAWPYLWEEEQYPISFDRREEPAHLGELSGKAKLRWLKLHEDLADQEDELLRDFLAVHDFSEGLHGIVLPKLLCLRRGKQMISATTRQEFILSFSETMATFENMGNEIVARLEGLTDKRSMIARARWTERDNVSALQRLKIATRLDIGDLRKVWPDNIELLASNDDIYELKAAARMLGRRVTDLQLETILKEISKIGHGQKLNVGVLAEKALDVIIEHESDTPAAQGYFLAEMLREHLRNQSDRVEPQEILRSWGVSIRELLIRDSNLDAIAVWGERHTPTIFLNSVGPRSQQEKGRRATLAHEMCHILVDLNGALPVAEVLGGNVPRAIEKRANAFAAEFLLPRFEASKYIEESLNYVYGDQREKVIEKAISELAEKYGASHETIAWQVLNSHLGDPKDEHIFEKKLRSVFDPFDAVMY